MRTCSVCNHPDFQRINESLLKEAEPLRNIAKQHNVSLSALHRHRNKCLPDHLIKAQEAREILDADNLISELLQLVKDARRITKKAESDEDFKTALTGIREQSRVVEIFMKVSGLLSEKSPVVSNQTTLTTIDVKAILLDPEAKMAARDLLNVRGLDPCLKLVSKPLA